MLISCIFALDLLLEEFGLHLIVVLGKLPHILVDILLLLPQHPIQIVTHPSKQTVDMASPFNFNALGSVTVIATTFELLPELAAPFGEDTQNGRTLYSHIHIDDLFLGVTFDVFRNFSSDEVIGVLFDFCAVFFFLLIIFLQSFLEFCRVGFGRSNVYKLRGGHVINNFELIYNLLFLLSSHPILVFHFFKDACHKLFKVFVVGCFGLCLRVCHVIDQPH